VLVHESSFILLVCVIAVLVLVERRVGAGARARDRMERRRSQEQLERLLASSTAVIYSLRPDGDFGATFVSENVTALTGYPAACFLESARFWKDRVHADDRDRVYQAFTSVLATGRHAAEYRFLHHDGSYRWMRDEVRVAYDETTSRPRELVGYWVDVTHRRQLEQQLAQALKLEAIGQLATGIAHEINTPIQYVGDNIRFLSDGFASLIALVDELRAIVAEGGAPAAARAGDATERVDLGYLMAEIPQALEQSLEGLARGASIVGAVKQFSHPTGDSVTSVDLNHEIHSAIAVSRNEWKHVAEVATDLDSALPPMSAHLHDIQQMLLNLIVNAAHAVADAHHDSREQGRITIATRRLGDRAELQVSDTGTGIAPAIRSRIFDPFFTTKEVGRGTGQGLALVRAVVVERHNGSIDFDTEVGRGTTFVVRLPLDTDSAVRPAA
jgi:PAS domain S-box-containing protein